MKLWVLLLGLVWQTSYSQVNNVAPQNDQERVDQLNALFKSTMQQEPIRALAYSNEALSLAESIDYDKGVAYALNNIGVIQNSIGNLDKALDYFFQSWRIHQAINNLDGLAATLNNIGTVYSSKRNYDKALDYFIRSHKIVESLQDTSRIIGSLNNIGNIHLARDEDDQAMEYYQESISLYRLIGEQYQAFDPHTNVGNIYFRKESYDSAMYFYQQSLGIEVANESLAGQAQALNNMGITFNHLRKYDQAINHQVDALEIAQSINSKPLVMDIYKALSDTYFNRKQWYLAKDYLLLHGMVKDSIYNEESNRKISDLERSYEMEQREQEIELLRRETKIQQLQLKNNRYSILTIIFGASILFSVAIFYYLKNQSSQKTRSLLASKNQEITESIHYAQSVQDAILDGESISRSFPQSFIFYRPKDIVSGDFYWHSKLNGYDILATVDCTGHGVAGAFMTVIGNSLLNQIVVENHESNPAVILEQLDIKLRQTLKDKKVSISNHGMDIAICRIDKTQRQLTFAGARSDLYIIRDGNLEELKGDRHTIGENPTEEHKAFQQQSIGYGENDLFYLSSDGFSDQFGEKPNKKFMKKNFKELLASIHEAPLTQQASLLADALKEWQGVIEQTDDILVLGIKCPCPSR